MFPAGTEWLPDFSINNSTEFLKPSHVLSACCNLLYHIFVQNKTLEDIIHKEKHCVTPKNINGHWVVFNLDSNCN